MSWDGCMHGSVINMVQFVEADAHRIYSKTKYLPAMGYNVCTCMMGGRELDFG